MNSDRLQHGYARFLLTQGRTAGEFAAFKAGVEYAETKEALRLTDSVERLIDCANTVVSYRNHASYSESLFGEKKGQFKDDLNELSRALNVLYAAPSPAEQCNKQSVVMESKSEIQRRIERAQEALDRPLKDTVKPAKVPDQVDDLPGMWDRSDFEGGATDRAQLSDCFNKHVLYETGDPDAPDAIKDSNGEVVLGLCKNCGAAEVELGRKCEPTRHQYYYKNSGCLATSVDDPECICWRDEGTGPFPDARHGNKTSSPALTWRKK